MMGEQSVMQEELFYGFSLERHVPADHLETSNYRHFRRRVVQQCGYEQLGGRRWLGFRSLGLMLVADFGIEAAFSAARSVMQTQFAPCCQTKRVRL